MSRRTHDTDPGCGQVLMHTIDGGETGIRTLDTLRYTRFPSVRLQPLGHLSKPVLHTNLFSLTRSASPIVSSPTRAPARWYAVYRDVVQRHDPAVVPTRRAHNSAVECHLHTVEVVGSNPAVPTIPPHEALVVKAARVKQARSANRTRLEFANSVTERPYRD